MAANLKDGDKVRLARKVEDDIYRFNDDIDGFKLVADPTTGSIGEITAVFTTGIVTFRVDERTIDLPKECFDIINE